MILIVTRKPKRTVSIHEIARKAARRSDGTVIDMHDMTEMTSRVLDVLANELDENPRGTMAFFRRRIRIIQKVRSIMTKARGGG